MIEFHNNRMQVIIKNEIYTIEIKQTKKQITYTSIDDEKMCT